MQKGIIVVLYFHSKVSLGYIMEKDREPEHWVKTFMLHSLQEVMARIMETQTYLSQLLPQALVPQKLLAVPPSNNILKKITKDV